MSGKNEISSEEKQMMLKLARDAVTAYLYDDKLAEPEDPTGILQRPGACFVTLHSEGGALRGCIGSLIATEPLGENIRRNALNAAFHDPRFEPVDLDEMAEISLEISVLTPPERIASPGDFQVGAEGIILRVDGRSAVFLPQVAPEQGWDRETTYFFLCRKAGLPPDAWRRPDAELSVFRAVVFGES